MLLQAGIISCFQACLTQESRVLPVPEAEFFRPAQGAFEP